MSLEWPQIWGFGVALFGVFFLIRRKIDIGIRGRPASFTVTGKWAIFLGFLIISLGLFVGLEIPKQLKIDRCLDGGGKFNYETKLCEHN